MARVHTYKQSGTDVAIFAIDHSVGRGGRNVKDDVQLIQVLINRYIDVEATLVKTHPETGRMRVSDTSGRQIDKLNVDGVCGPLTLAAILATQRSLNVWRRCAVDGRIDAIMEGGASQYDGSQYYRFNTMYILAIGARADADSYSSGYARIRQGSPDFEPLEPIDLFSLPDPLKTSLLRSSLVNAVGPFAGHARDP